MGEPKGKIYPDVPCTGEAAGPEHIGEVVVEAPPAEIGHDRFGPIPFLDLLKRVRDTIERIVPGDALELPFTLLPHPEEGLLQAVLGVDDFPGVDPANTHRVDGVALEGKDLFNPAVDQLHLHPAASGAYAADAGHPFGLVLVGPFSQ